MQTKICDGQMDVKFWNCTCISAISQNRIWIGDAMKTHLVVDSFD